MRLKVEDYYPSGKRSLLRFKERAAKKRSSPSITSSRSFSTNTSGPPASAPSRIRFSSQAQCERPGSYRAGRSCAPTPHTCLKGGSSKPGCRRIIRRTHSGRPASRIFWRTTAPLRPRTESPATPTAGRRSSTTAAVKRCCSKIWRGFGISGH
jgi:hypothetical protein